METEQKAVASITGKIFSCGCRSWVLSGRDMVVDKEPELLSHKIHECDKLIVWQKGFKLERFFMKK